MMIKVVASLVLLALTFISVVSADNYVPCKGWLSFSYDDSNTLSSDDFKTQMTFIKTSLSNMTHPERLRVEGAYTGEFNWQSPLSLSQMQKAIDSAQQTQNSFSLAQHLAGLVTSVQVLGSTFDQIVAVIFVSDTSDRALANAGRWFSMLKNVDITFVVLGKSADAAKLEQFSNNTFTWEDFSNQMPNLWDNFAAFGCRALQKTCNSDIAILIDSSLDVGKTEDFQKQIDYITTSLIPSWNTISLKSNEAYSMMYSSQAVSAISNQPWNYKDMNAFIAELTSVRNTTTLRGYDSMALGFQFFLWQIRNSNFGDKLAVIVFTYTDYMVNVQDALPFTKQIDGKIIVVGVGKELDDFALSFISKDVILTDKEFNGDITAKINQLLC